MAMHYETRISLGLGSVDRAGVLFYPRLFDYAHEAYEAFMDAQGLSLAGLLAQGEYRLPIVHARADYLIPMPHGSGYAVQLSLSRLGTTSFTVATAFIGAHRRLHARVESVHVCVAVDGGRPMALPDALRRGLRPYADTTEGGH